MFTKSTPDSKELYGKAKKEDTPMEEKPAEQTKAANPFTFDNISFPDDNGDKYRFFNTHVKPGIKLRYMYYIISLQ
jgi:hypothetical protein